MALTATSTETLLEWCMMQVMREFQSEHLQRTGLRLVWYSTIIICSARFIRAMHLCSAGLRATIQQDRRLHLTVRISDPSLIQARTWFISTLHSILYSTILRCMPHV